MQRQTVCEFLVAGFSARTNNEVEMTGQGKIPQLWGHFMSHRLIDSLPATTGSDIYAVYTDYETDYRGNYTFLLGYRISSLDGLPDGLTTIAIQPGEYSVLSSEVGPAMQVVPALWQKIWSLSPAELGVRAYKTDFELYDHRAADPASAQVDVFIGI